MKKYTEKDLKTFERDEDGYLICPIGDYRAIREFNTFCKFGDDCIFDNVCRFGRFNTFGNGCSFGSKCSFGNFCYFGEACEFGCNCDFGKNCEFQDGCKFETADEEVDRFIKIDRIGSRNSSTYFFKTVSGYIFVRCGCFLGDIDDFEVQVKETHKNNARYLNEYMGAITYAKSVLLFEAEDKNVSR